PATSRQSPVCTLVMVPLLLTFHCWLVPPWQSQISTLVPAAVPAPATSRHLVPYTTSHFDGVSSQDWLLPPLQSQIESCTPLVVVAPGTSRHRPEPDPRITAAVPVPRPQAHLNRLTPDALLLLRVRLAPLPPSVSMLYVSPVRNPGQYTEPMPSDRNVSV